MTEDLTQQSFWNDIVDAYEHVIIRTTAHKELTRDVANQVSSSFSKAKAAKRFLDAGCGLGSVISRVVSENNDARVLGIDANQEMLNRVPRIIGSEMMVNVELKQEDVQEIDYSESFDVISSANVLFNLKDPFKFIGKAYDALDDNGSLVISSALPGYDLDFLVSVAKQELPKDPKTQRLIHVAEQVNEEMSDSAFKTFYLEEISEILNNYYSLTPKFKGKTFLDQNFLVSASKDPVGKFKFSLESGKENYEEAWKLKDFTLKSLLGLPSPYEGDNFSTPYDEHSFLLTARDSITNKLLGFQNIILDSEMGLPAEETTDISSIRSKYNKLISLSGTYIVPRVRNLRLGAFLINFAAELMSDRGYDCSVMESNPRLVEFMERCGSVRYGSDDVTHEGLPKVNILMELQENRNLRKDVVNQLYDKVGEENIIIDLD